MDELRGTLAAAGRAMADWFFGRGGDGAIGQLPPDQKLLLSLAVVGGLAALRFALLRLVLPGVHDRHARYRWRRTTQYIFAAMGVFLVLELWFPHFENLATYLGLLSAGIAVALRDPIANVVGWAYLVWRRPFAIGDRIQIGETAGDVVDMRFFEFSLNEIGNWVHADQSTGRVIHVPNQKVFTLPLANYTRGFEFLWNELRVPLTLDSDWEAAQAVLKAIAYEQAAEVLQDAQSFLDRGSPDDYLIYYRTLTPAVYTALEDRGIVLTVRHLVHPRRRRGATHAMWQAILRAFADRDDFQLAWPTQRIEIAQGRSSAAQPRQGDPGEDGA
jgi:small-conductance mechanosensitive channel